MPSTSNDGKFHIVCGMDQAVDIVHFPRPRTAHFLQCLRNRGELNGVRLLGPHTVDFMTADHLGNIPAEGTLLPPGHGFGLGFAVRTHLGLSPVPGMVSLYCWGGIAGTTFFVNPARYMVAMPMTQASNQRD